MKNTNTMRNASLAALAIAGVAGAGIAIISGNAELGAPHTSPIGETVSEPEIHKAIDETAESAEGSAPPHEQSRDNAATIFLPNGMAFPRKATLLEYEGQHPDDKCSDVGGYVTCPAGKTVICQEKYSCTNEMAVFVDGIMIGYEAQINLLQDAYRAEEGGFELLGEPVFFSRTSASWETEIGTLSMIERNPGSPSFRFLHVIMKYHG
ncbi:hypothetical protein [Phenylobacterium ferrooxidans]|uniref:Uncharacterized protein n=1 Tax=Phenylobacterium ferrooxidans TaxID=2982689 RepID=A0ABW6CJY7_9CAUL